MLARALPANRQRTPTLLPTTPFLSLPQKAYTTMLARGVRSVSRRVSKQSSAPAAARGLRVAASQFAKPAPVAAAKFAAPAFAAKQRTLSLY